MSIDTKEIVLSALRTQIVKAFDDDKTLLDTLIGEALQHQVEIGSGYSSRRVPFLQYTAGEVIRKAAREAIEGYMSEYADQVKERVRAALQADGLVSALTEKLTWAMKDTWSIEVKFKDER